MSRKDATPRKVLKVVLVAMPWQAFDRPSMPLALLSAFIKREEPRLDVSCQSEFIKVWLQARRPYELLSRHPLVGELVYLAHLYPERLEQARLSFCEELRARCRHQRDEGKAPPEKELDESTFDRLYTVTGDHLARAATKLAEEADVVGLTTSMGQLFASLCLANLIKAIKPEAKIILGGSAATVAGRAAFSHSWVDYVVLGEGEQRLLWLLRRLLAGEAATDCAPGVLARGQNRQEKGAPNTGAAAPDSSACSAGSPRARHAAASEVSDLDLLPLPDFDEYVAHADRHNILWWLPVEGSRGCWWDRRLRTRDPLQACYFCGVNGRRSRRDKSVTRLAREVDELTSRYTNATFFFTDMVVRRRESRALARALRATGRTCRFFMESRVSIGSLDLLELWEAGCSGIQLGIEGLSTSYLKRLNKGTKTIENLRAMRLCFELGLRASSNLLIGFPGATAAEVSETRDNIIRYAIAYEPLSVSRFSLDVDSPVYDLPERFGISRVRAARAFAEALPPEVAASLPLPWLAFDTGQPQADWQPVIEACRQWRELHQVLQASPLFPSNSKSLFYLDSVDFLEITDRRTRLRTITLGRLERDIYMFCMEIRSLGTIVETFKRRASEATLVSEILAPLVAERVVFEEGGRYLSLAAAWRPDVAARRIRESERSISSRPNVREARALRRQGHANGSSGR